MKYRKIVKTLDRMLYLIGKQGISDRGTKETAADSDNLWNPGNFFSHCSANYTLLSFTIWAH